MRIDYNVLWFENEKTWLNPTRKNLKNFLEDYGFKLQVTEEKDDSNLGNIINDIKNNVLDIDIIFMDYKLAKEQKGDAFIKSIREKELFTEIIFYSMEPNIKTIIEDSVGSVEGIYYSTRNNFLDKVKTVIKHTIKKVQEVNSMRGLIMSAVSDLDEKMFSIIENAIKSTKVVGGVKIGEVISKYTFTVCEEFLDTKNRNFAKYKSENDYTSLINDTLIFDLSKKSKVIQKVVKLLNNADLIHLNKFCEDFNINIIQPRNAFGHVTSEIRDGKKVLVPKRGSEIVFTDEKCIEIRKALINYTGHIELVNTTLNF